MNVAVVGAGIVGGAIAFHLARRGAEVTLIDAGEPGMGATSHSFAWINSFGKEPRHYGALNRRALDTWDRFARLLDADIGLRWGGQLTWAATDDVAEALAAKVAVVGLRRTHDRRSGDAAPGTRPQTWNGEGRRNQRQ